MRWPKPASTGRKTYITNAVKHFKFERRGKRRIHQKPTAGEVKHYRWWLEPELQFVHPRLVVALGATAVLALAGKSLPIGKNRGPIRFGEWPGYITVHPSYLLRIPDEASKAQAYKDFVGDLKRIRKLAEHEPLKVGKLESSAAHLLHRQISCEQESPFLIRFPASAVFRGRHKEKTWNRKHTATSLTTSRSNRRCSARSSSTIRRSSAFGSILKAEDFYDPLHQRIYQALVTASERGGMVLTPLTLHALMKADPGLIEVGGHAYLAGLLQAAPALPNVATSHASSRSRGAPHADPYRRGHRQHGV